MSEDEYMQDKMHFYLIHYCYQDEDGNRQLERNMWQPHKRKYQLISTQVMDKFKESAHYYNSMTDSESVKGLDKHDIGILAVSYLGEASHNEFLGIDVGE